MEVVYALHFNRTVKLKNVFLFLVLLLGIIYAESVRAMPRDRTVKDIQRVNKDITKVPWQGGILINDIQVRSIDANTTDVKLMFAGSVTPRYFILKSPSRLVVDIPQGHLKSTIRLEGLKGTLVKNVRQGEQPNQVLRLVFDLDRDASVSPSMGDPTMMVLHLKNKSPAAAKTNTVLPAVMSKSSKAKVPICSADLTPINDIQVRRIDANTTDVTFIFGDTPKVHYFTLQNSMRFIVDVKRGCLKTSIDPKMFTDTFIKGLRQGKQPNQVLRLVFDMNQNLSVIQSGIDSKVMVFQLKKKNVHPIIASTPVVAKPDNPLPNTPAKTPVVLPNKSDASKGISTSVQHDSLLLVVGQIKSFFSFNDKQAVALELDGGPRVLRGNGTYAYAFNDNNRLKLTAEYLEEDLDFEFYTGDTRQWVQQGAVGAAYEYLLGDNIFKNITVGSHYSHAQSKDLSTETIVYADGSTLTDYRRIAGGNDLNGNAEAGMQLWKDGVVTVGPDYDRVRYDTKYEYQEGQNAQGFGGHVRLEQKLKNNVGLQLNSTISQLFDTYGAGLNWAWSTKDNTVWSAGLASSYTQDRTTERNFWINGVTVTITWDVPQIDTKAITPSLNNDDRAVGSLAQWAQVPAVRMPDVLAISDERIIKTAAVVPPFVSVTDVCPGEEDIQYNAATHSYSAGNGKWYQYYLGVQNSSAVYTPVFDSANITGTPAGVVSCFYGLSNQFHLNKGNLVLRNSDYQNVISEGGAWSPGYSLYWPDTGLPSPDYTCPAINQECKFETVA